MQAGLKGDFGIFRGQHKQKKRKKKALNMCLTTTASEVAQTLVSVTSKMGLGKEGQAA